jgi:lipopolysaccharide/colanic/teichoic acid biosynthesis glycosyltransferase
MGKRLFDLVCAAAGLIIASPLLALIALAVVGTSRGPVFFRQERIGRGFAPFRIVKFRTMFEGIDGPLVTSRGDRRVTPVGRLLRRTKLDELPQLWNVVCGDMSLVGPRPEVRRYVEMFRADYEVILRARPGITDPASLKFRREELLLAAASDPEAKYVTEILPQKIAMAKEYVRTRSFAGDLVLILRTVAHL